ncbi:MAG: hypothetical protein KUG77_02485 [Nannocystaceae bacterium]|nr:hypothetical protein [Nannocystaceae bacterium]
MERIWRFLIVSSLGLAMACGVEDGRGQSAAGLGEPFGDPLVVANDGELLAVLNQAADHLGTQDEWGLDDEMPAEDEDEGEAGGGESEGEDDSDGDSPAPAASCAGNCGGEAPGGSCFCDSTCTEYSDCCGDYDSVCDGSSDGGDSGDSDSGDEPEPPGASSCSGACGGQGSGGCYCDAGCSAKGDCCSDYAAQCGGSRDSGDEPEPDPPAGGSCVDACGGAGSGDCYCDGTCVDSGDCCADYDVQCGIGGPEHEPGFEHGLNPVGRSQAANASGGLGISPEVQAGTAQVCMALIDDDVNVGRILTAAGRSGAKQGARCFAAAVVVTVGSGGTAAPASSVVCVASSAGASVIGGAKEYIRQKRSDIALCGVSVAADAVSAVLSAASAIGVYEVKDVDEVDETNTEAETKALEMVDKACSAGNATEAVIGCLFYFHYTDQAGLNGIMGSADKVILADGKGRVYMTWIPYSPEDVRTSLVFSGDNAGKGDYVIAFQLNPDVLVRPGDAPNEVIHEGSLRLGTKASIYYAGTNAMP